MRIAYVLVTSILMTSTAWAAPSALRLDERVDLRMRLERIRHDQRLGVNGPSERRVPRDVVAGSVRDGLRQSAALATRWDAPITIAALERELERIRRETTMPERLDRFFEALDRDRHLILEILVRPVLAERLARQQFDADETIEPGLSWDVWWAEHGATFDDATSRVVTARPSDEPVALAPRGPGRSGAVSQGATSPCTAIGWDPIVAPPPSEYAAGVWTGSEMLIWPAPGESFAAFRYDPVIDTTTPLSTVGAPPPSSRFGPTAVWTGTEMIVWLEEGFGGRYDPSTDSWAAISTTGAPGVLDRHTATWTGSEMIIWGGAAGFDGARYDPVSDTWSAITATQAPDPRRDHTAVWTGARMVVWGGRDFQGDANRADGGLYDPSTDSWIATPSTSIAPRRRHSAVWTGSEMIVWGGENTDELDDGARYVPNGPLGPFFTPLPSAGAPDARRDHAAVWTGSEMVVWGGRGGISRLFTGGRYDPSTGQWAATSTSGAPGGRIDPVAVWTGSELVVWGGGQSVTTANGGRYDPSSDDWDSFSSEADMPRPDNRGRQAAVWTGAEFILWGDANEFLLDPDDGWRFDPVLAAWSPTSTIGAPIGRWAHSAVWTGTEMIVWGGRSDVTGVRADGAAYDPVSDTWVALPPAGILGWDHTAVWTGTEMVVYGGEICSSAPGDVQCPAPAHGSVRRYDPQTQSWSSGADGPPRSGHAAVWTGSEMIVYGDNADPEIRYDPIGDVWTVASTAGAPPGGGTYDLVWTGTELIATNSTGTESGRYDPAGDSWSSLSSTGHPASIRTLNWNGGAVVAIGDLGGVLYDPATDVWTATPTVGTPALSGTGPSAVWTGRALLALGADDNASVGAALAIDCDVDFDGVVDYDDNCPVGANPAQADGDGDAVGDVCDSCLFLANVDQTDTDGDGAGDVCDCLPLDSLGREPPVIAPLLVDRSGTTAELSWPGSPFATLYQVTRGAIDELTTGDYGDCLASGILGTMLTDGVLPDPGEGFAYLVQGQNLFCGAGPIGPDSGGFPRVNGSSGACP